MVKYLEYNFTYFSSLIFSFLSLPTVQQSFLAKRDWETERVSQLQVSSYGTRAFAIDYPRLRSIRTDSLRPLVQVPGVHNTHIRAGQHVARNNKGAQVLFKLACLDRRMYCTYTHIVLAYFINTKQTLETQAIQNDHSALPPFLPPVHTYIRRR